MRILISFFGVLFGQFLYAQDSTLLKYERRSDTLVAKLKLQEISDEEKKELKVIAYGIQNYGQYLEDSKGDYVASLIYTNKAIDLFIYLDDTLSQANNRKFKGYLLGMQKDYVAAKNETLLAIKLYNSKNNFPGIAVSEFDLSRVYDQERKFDTAIYFCNKSLDFWKIKSNTWRILNVQTMLIYLLTRSHQYEKAISNQKECEKFINDKEINPRDQSDFYFVLVQLYKSMGKPDLEKSYQLKLTEAKSKAETFTSYYKAL